MKFPPSAAFVLFAASLGSAISVAKTSSEEHFRPDDIDGVMELRPNLLFIGVMSAPENIKRREEIRATWMRHAALNNKSNVVAKFMIGEAPPDVERKLEVENMRFNDIVRLNIVEDYANLTRKTLLFFKWAATQHRSTRFVMKLDDDTFPTLERLLPILEGKTNPYVYLGAIMDGGPVQREGKWAEDPVIFKEEFYPTYAAGSGYILSTPLAAELQEAHRFKQVRLLANEDTTVGVWVHDFAKLQKQASVDFHSVEASVCGCVEGGVLAMQLQPGELRCMWEKYTHGGKPGGGECCRPLRCYGLHQVTQGDVLFWATNSPPAECPVDTADPARNIVARLLAGHSTEDLIISEELGKQIGDDEAEETREEQGVSLVRMRGHGLDARALMHAVRSK